MKARDLWLELFDHRAERRIEGHAIARRHWKRWIDAKFLVIGLEPIAPAGLARIELS
jgi:hypothetical protein